MKTFKNKYFQSLGRVCCGGAVALMGLSTTLTGCSDFFEPESENVIYAGDEHLNNSVDTIYSLTGILSKLEALGDRTILLGELRGDLMEITANADGDLVDIAQFNINEDNRYNAPRDYYAVINNCNYYIEHVDTALKNNRNEYIFMREYAAVKAIRAWTYLQLAINYGHVPFVDKPILTKEAADQQYPSYDLDAICDYFIRDLEPLSPLYGNETPRIGVVQGVDSRYFYYPLDVIIADLYLWRGGKENAKQAAVYYHKFLSEHNGANSVYPTGYRRMSWKTNANTFMRPEETSWRSEFYGTRERTYGKDNELITVIAGDSLPAEPHYSQIRNYFNSTSNNDYIVSAKPSQGLVELSEAQEFCNVSSNGTSVSYVPKGMSDYRSGDLRLYGSFGATENASVVYSNGQQDHIDYYQQIYKWDTGSRNVPILRRQMVYLRLAEALNAAGYPRMAFLILSNGINNNVIRDEVLPYYHTDADSIYLSKFDFPAGTGKYEIFTAEHLVGLNRNSYNTMGIHSRGSGWTPLNEYYVLVNDTIESDESKRSQLVTEQQHYVDSLILQEGALECAFEGTRFYDLMRYCKRQDNPGETMEYYIYGRRGKNGRGNMGTEIKKNLRDERNWYLYWDGNLGTKAE